MIKLRDGKLKLIIYKKGEDQPEVELDLKDFDEKREDEDVILYAEWGGYRFFVEQDIERG